MKLVLKILAGLVIALFVVVVSLLLFFDPNMFKPRIESMARDQGVALAIDGNLGWRLWPNLGVEVNGIRVAALTSPEDQIAQLERASLLLAVRPLLRGDVQVHHIIVEGARINLIVDKEGTGNWEALIPDDEAEPTATDPVAEDSEEGTDFTLAVERISLRDSELSYSDLGSGQQFSLRDLGVEIGGFNLQGEAFELTLGWLAEVTDPELFGGQTLSALGDLRSTVQVATDFNDLRITDGDLTLNLSRGNKSGKVNTRFNAEVTDLQEVLNYQVSVHLPVFNPRQLLSVLDLDLETSKADALTQLGANLRIVGDTRQVRMDPFELRLDKTLLKVYLAIINFETMALRASITGDEINIDDYLPPASEEVIEEAEATGDEIVIPLDVIRPLDLQFTLEFKKIVVAKMPLLRTSVRLQAKEGLITLSRAYTELHKGKVSVTASLDGRSNTAVIAFDGGAEGVHLAPLMRDLELEEPIGLTGTASALVAGGTSGLTMNQLMAGLTAEASFSGAQVRVSPVNVEKLICQAINTISQVEQPQRAWDEFTEMRELTGKVIVDGPEVRLESFDAAVQQLSLGMRGKLNLDSSAYDFTLPLRLLDSTTGEHGCTVRSNYWINRSLSLLRCRGSLAELNPLNDCRPDPRGLQSLTKDFAEYQLRARHGDRIDAAERRLQETRQQADEKKAEIRQEADEKKEELRREADEKLEQEKKELENRLRDRLRR